MLTPERHQLILSLLKEKEVVKLQELVDGTNSSESTIRRDLIQLESERKLKRVHGGAALLQGKRTEPSIAEKSTKNLHEKQMVAREAATLISEGDCVYIDAGTTTMQMIPHINSKDVTVVTNGLTLIESLLEKGIRTYVVGGAVKGTTRALIGRLALIGLETYRFDKCFIGVNGIHIDYGYTTPDPEEAFIKQAAINLSQEKFIVADHSKLGEVSFSKISDLNSADLIVNDPMDDRMKEYKQYTTVKVVTA
jgi:DeoR family fructose operon transcriptional repressor